MATTTATTTTTPTTITSTCTITITITIALNSSSCFTSAVSRSVSLRDWRYSGALADGAASDLQRYPGILLLIVIIGYSISSNNRLFY